MSKPIVLSDPFLDESDPHTRMFLLCEHWRNRTDEARDLLRRLIDAIDGNGGGLLAIRNEADEWLGKRATDGVPATQTNQEK
jgi:hypothetical protein